MYYDLGEYEKTLVGFDKAIVLDPELVYVYCNRGIMYKISSVRKV